MIDSHLLLDSGEAIPFRVSIEKRIRRVRIVIDSGGLVRVRVPQGVPLLFAKRFIHKQKSWIQKTVVSVRRRAEKQKHLVILSGSRAECASYRAKAEMLVRTHIAALSIPYADRIVHIGIGNQKTRWGSCSRRGVLRFNYRIVHLPESVQRYLVAHEVAHMRHMNHSRDFWCEVERLLPTYVQQRAILRRYRISAR